MERITEEERNKIECIVDRFKKINWDAGHSMSAEMETTILVSITICHVDGIRLDLDKLLDAPAFDFVHDVVGIMNHLKADAEKGVIMDPPFVPRCAEKQKTA